MKTQARRSIGAAVPVAVLVLAALMSGACAGRTVAPEPEMVLGGETHRGGLTPLQIRDRLRAFADYYRDKVAAVCDRIADESDDPVRSQRVLQMKIDAVTAMYDIAVDPAPTTAMINALVMVSLQANTAERHGPSLFGPAGGAQILAAAKEIQEEGFGIAARVMTQEQRQQLLDLVRGWTEQNPGEFNIWYVRLNNLPGVQGKVTVLSMVDTLTDLPSIFLGKFIPGVTSVTSTGESVGDATVLAERMSWLAPRLLIVAQWRAEMLIHRSLEAPQVTESLDVARRVTGVMETLPGTLNAQREALFNSLEQHDAVVTGLLDRADSVAGHAAVLMEKVDTVVARVQTMIAASAIANVGKRDVPARPFDITEYTAALAELDATVQNAARLLDGVESATQEDRLAAKLDVVKADVSGLIWLAGGVLGGAVAFAGLLIVLAVKLIPRRG